MAEEQTIKERVDKVIARNDAIGALRLINELKETRQATSNEAEIAAIDRIIARLRVVSLSFTRDKTAEDLFEKFPFQIASSPDSVDVIGNIRDRLVEETFVEQRNALRDRWRAAMERSNQRFGTESLLLGDQEVPPTIGNWLRLYVSEVGTGRASSVALARFFSQNANVQSLSPDDRQILKNLINVYEFLKLRSQDLEGFEGADMVTADDGSVHVFEDGQAYPLYDEEDLRNFEERAKKGELSLDQLIFFKTNYPQRFEQYKMPSLGLKPEDVWTPEKVEQSLKNFLEEQRKKFTRAAPVKPLPDSASDLAGLLMQSLKQPTDSNIMTSKAALSEVATSRAKLRDFLENAAVERLIKTSFPKEMGQKNKELVEQSILHPVAFQALLMIVFKNSFNLSEEEALWYSHDIVQEFPDELRDFKTIVTFDVMSNQLAWRY